MREFTVDLARRAGELLLSLQRRGLARVDTKLSHMDLVTEGDLAAERMITDAIRARYPDHAIYGEESAQGDVPLSGWTWVIDPVDGTSNYAHGVPLFAVNIGLLHDGAPVLAVTHAPALARTFWAEEGGGAWLRTERSYHRLRVSRIDEINRAMLVTGFPHDRASNPDNNLAEFIAFDKLSQGVRRLGSAAINVAWVAAGWLDAYWESRCKIWDWAPGALMVREAGGLVTDYDGQPWTASSRTMIASNGQTAFHARMQDVIQTARQEAGITGN